MPSFERRFSGSAAVGDFLVLTDERAESAVVVAESRGALVTSFRAFGRELLYMDETTLFDPSKNVRGGVPVLFPSPGKLEGNAFTWNGHSGKMNQHGFARTLAWKCEEPSSTTSAQATVTLASSDVTRAEYPWDFRANFTFALDHARLRITQKVQNTGTTSMPFGVGFHPYFRVENKAAARIDTKATRAYDNVEKRTVPFTGFDLTAKEVDLHLLDHGSTASALHFGDGSRVEVRGSKEFARWVVWTLAGKDFVCLEPWTCPGNALNTGERLIVLEPGAVSETFVEIALS